MSDLKNLKRGDAVVIDKIEGLPVNSTVESIGSKFITANNVKFDINTGYRTGNYLGATYVLYTPVQWERKLLEKQYLEMLEKVSKLSDPTSVKCLSDDALKAATEMFRLLNERLAK